MTFDSKFFIFRKPEVFQSSCTYKQEVLIWRKKMIWSRLFILHTNEENKKQADEKHRIFM